jgi:hypothetical protein
MLVSKVESRRLITGAYRGRRGVVKMWKQSGMLFLRVISVTIGSDCESMQANVCSLLFVMRCMRCRDSNERSSSSLCWFRFATWLQTIRRKNSESLSQASDLFHHRLQASHPDIFLLHSYHATDPRPPTITPRPSIVLTI